MATEITETEVVASPLKRVSVGSQKLRVPRSPSLHFMFMHTGFVKKFQDESLVDEDVEDYFAEVLAFLRDHNPKVDEDKLKRECSLADLLGFYVRWFGADDGDEETGDERPPRRRGTSGPRRTTSRSRS